MRPAVLLGLMSLVGCQSGVHAEDLMGTWFLEGSWIDAGSDCSFDLRSSIVLSPDHTVDWYLSYEYDMEDEFSPLLGCFLSQTEYFNSTLEGQWSLLQGSDTHYLGLLLEYEHWQYLVQNGVDAAAVEVDSAVAEFSMAVELPLYLQADGQYESLYVNGYGHHIRVESPP